MTTHAQRFFEKILYFSSLAPSMHAVCHSQTIFLHITTKYHMKQISTILLICDIYHVPIYLFFIYLFIYLYMPLLTLILPMWRIWRASNNDSRWDLTQRLKG